MAASLTRVDLSGATALALCRACPWRGTPTTNRARARAEADAHRRREHPTAAKDTRNKRRRREVTL